MQKLVVLGIALGLCSIGSASALAQTQQQILSPTTTTSENGTPTSPDAADLAITSTVTARELRFQVVPNSKIEFSGSPERITGWQTQRENLPKRVQPGVTYRNIGVHLEITSVFSDIDHIVSDAPFEVPNQQITPQAGEGMLP